MLPVHRYVDMGHPQFKGKTDLELWYMMDEVTRNMVFAEYVGEQVREGLDRIGRSVVSSILIQQGGSNVPPVINGDCPVSTTFTATHLPNTIASGSGNGGGNTSIP